MVEDGRASTVGAALLSVTTLVLTASGPFARLKAWGLKRILICDWRFTIDDLEKGSARGEIEPSPQKPVAFTLRLSRSSF